MLDRSCRRIAVLVLVLAAGGLAGPMAAGAAGGQPTIIGKVTDASGAPVAGLCVGGSQQTVGPMPGAPVPGTTTRADGSYTLQPFTGGTFVVRFGGCTGSQYPAEDSAPVTVETGGSTVLNFTLKPPATIAGRVVDDRGLPVAGVEVDAFLPAHVVASAGSTLVAKTNASGRYSLPRLLANTYRVVISAPNDYEPGTGEMHTVKLASGQQVSGINATLIRDATVTARAVNRSGHPLAGMCVALESVDAQHRSFTVVAAALTNSSGRVRVPEIPARRTLAIEVSPDLAPPGQPCFPGRAMYTRKGLTFKPGETRKLGDLVTGRTQ